MSREKQIEEIAKDIFESKVAIDGIDIAFAAVHGANVKDSHFMRIAKHLVCNKGYRKQSEGEWIDKHCSNCGEELPFERGGNAFATTFHQYKTKYCPNCGAKMKGGAE